MELDQKIEKLQEMVKEQAAEMMNGLKTMQEELEDDASVSSVDKYFEDLALAHHRLIQTTSMLGYFEMLAEGDDPLERM